MVVFIDYKKVFDSLKREEIWKILEKNRNCNRPFEKSEK
jgi:hypothetical protein